MRILLVDEQALFLDSLKGALLTFEDVQFVATASDGHAAAALYRSERCDLCLMDVGSPGLAWGEAMTHILEQDPDAKVAALTARADETLAIEMVLRGAKGFLLKQALLSELVWAIKRIHQGYEVFAPEVQACLTRRVRACLTPTETLGHGRSPARNERQVRERSRI